MLVYQTNPVGVQVLLPFDHKFQNFRNGDKWYGNFLGKVPEDPEIVEFPKSEPFNRKFRKFWDESQMERNAIITSLTSHTR